MNWLCLYRRQIYCPLWIALLLGAGALRAEAGLDRPRMTAMRIPEIVSWDKVFSDASWQRATAVSLQAPLNVTFKTPAEKTEVRALWCKDFLLVRFDCHDQSIVHLPGNDAAVGKRDLPYFKADAVEAFLDPVGDGRMYMEFQFSPDKGIFDAIYFCTTAPRSNADFMLQDDVGRRDLFTFDDWNLEGLRTAARMEPIVEGQGWSVIAAFPAKEILHRLDKTGFVAGMEMKINFVRFNYFAEAGHPCEITNWAPVLAGCAHISPTGMGTIILGP